jgi:hypothetical protein
MGEPSELSFGSQSTRTRNQQALWQRSAENDSQTIVCSVKQEWVFEYQDENGKNLPKDSISYSLNAKKPFNLLPNGFS